MRNSIYLRRALKVVLPKKSGQIPLNVIATMNKNLEQLGFCLSAELFEALQHTDLQEMERFYAHLIKGLKKLVGAHRVFRPLYPNFPKQVMQMSEAELYLNAVRHYCTHQIPASSVDHRSPAENVQKYRQIHLGSREDFEGLCKWLMQSKTPFSLQDIKDVRWIISQYQENVSCFFSKQMLCKENIALIASELWQLNPSNLGVFNDFCNQHIQTATDVLRLAAAFSQGDVSLAKPCHFKRFRRPQRVALLFMLEKATNVVEDMLRWKGRWIRLGERLHPGEYRQRYPQAAQAFDVVRNGLPHISFNSQIEQYFAKYDLEQALRLLRTRPGEFARRLDHLLRLNIQLQGNSHALDSTECALINAVDTSLILEQLSKKALEISTTVLLQVMAHFRSRHELESPKAVRSFFPKGEVAKVFTLMQPLPALPRELSLKVVDICEQTLLQRFKSLAPLGRCYIDPEMENYLVPFSQRSASKSLRTVVRGSQLSFPSSKVLRFFIWWKNGKGCVDIDLSAAMFGNDYRYIDTLAYYNLKNFGAYHSGDIVDAPQGASEFIDVDIELCREKKVRYIVMVINSYTSQPFCDLPECFCGWMGRYKPNSGEIFEPKLVVDKVDVASNTQICLPAIFDIEKNQMIWADVALRRYPRYVNNVHGNLRGVSLMLQAMTQMKKMDLYTLFDLHVRARGEKVQFKSDADMVFSPHHGITPFDLERISAEFL